MKAIAVFLLFVGMFLIVQGYYSQKAQCPKPKVEVKYIPKTLYDEQLSEPTVSKHFKGMFEDVHTWPTIRN
jgi:hypothetical protein